MCLLSAVALTKKSSMPAMAIWSFAWVIHAYPAVIPAHAMDISVSPVTISVFRPKRSTAPTASSTETKFHPPTIATVHSKTSLRPADRKISGAYTTNALMPVSWSLAASRTAMMRECRCAGRKRSRSVSGGEYAEEGDPYVEKCSLV